MASASTTRNALLIVGLFGLAWAQALGVTGFVSPSNIDWMFDGDWMAHLFGWLFTRNGPWGLPLGAAPDLIAPWGSSAAMTDAIPPLSVLGKLLSPFFGERMQLFGLWMTTGVIGTGVAGVLVARAWLKDTASLALAGCLFVMNPVVSARAGHPAFFAFWTLTGLVGAALWPATSLQSARRTALATLGLGFFACSTHGYLAVMASGLVGASILRLVLARHFKPAEALGWLVAGPVVCVSSLWLFGFVAGARASTPGSLAIEGFGEFSADPLTFINPLNWSRYFGPLRIGGRQYEGFAYLGLGVLSLLGVRLALLVRYRPTRRELLLALPLLLVAALMFVYALSNLVTFQGRVVANFTSFYENLAPWPSVFRSSGRFVWPLFALLTMTAALATARLERAWLRQLVLGFGVLLQVTDVNPGSANLHRPFGTFVPFQDPAWQLMKDGYQHVVVHPVQLQWICPFDAKFMGQLSWEAYRQHLSLNSGHVGRPPPGTDCKAHFPVGALDRETIYIPYFKEYFVDFAQPQLACGPIEGRAVCVFRDHDTPLLRELLRRAPPG